MQIMLCHFHFFGEVVIRCIFLRIYVSIKTLARLKHVGLVEPLEHVNQSVGISQMDLDSLHIKGDICYFKPCCKALCWIVTAWKHSLQTRLVFLVKQSGF